MTVWIVNPFDNLPPEGYRPQRYWLMARAFARAGHRVTYWSSDFSHAHKAPRKFNDPASEGFRLVLGKLVDLHDTAQLCVLVCKNEYRDQLIELTQLCLCTASDNDEGFAAFCLVPYELELHLCDIVLDRIAETSYCP